MAIYFDGLQVAGNGSSSSSGCAMSSTISAIYDNISTLSSKADNIEQSISQIQYVLQDVAGNCNSLDAAAMVAFDYGCSCEIAPYDGRLLYKDTANSLMVDGVDSTRILAYSPTKTFDFAAGQKIAFRGNGLVLPFRYGKKYLDPEKALTATVKELFEDREKAQQLGLSGISINYSTATGYATLNNWDQDISYVTFETVYYPDPDNHSGRRAYLARRKIEIEKTFKNLNHDKDILIDISPIDIKGRGTSYTDTSITPHMPIDWSFTQRNLYSTGLTVPTMPIAEYYGGSVIVPCDQYTRFIISAEVKGYCSIYESDDFAKTCATFDENTASQILKTATTQNVSFDVYPS